MTQLALNMTVMNDEKIQLQVKISESANESLEVVRNKLGMTKVELLSRLCTTFAQLPPTAQKLMVGLVDDELKPAAREVLMDWIAKMNQLEADVDAAVNPPHPPKRKAGNG